MSDIRDVKKKYEHLLLAIDGVTSVGIGGRSEHPAIVVGLSDIRALPHLPFVLDEYPVEMMWVDKVSAQRKI